MSENKKNKKKNIELNLSYTDNSEVVNGSCTNSTTGEASLISIGNTVNDTPFCIKISDDEIQVDEYKYNQRDFQSVDEAQKYIEEFKKNNKKSLLDPILITNNENGITTVYTPNLHKGLYVNLAEQKKELRLKDLQNFYKECRSAEKTYLYLKETISQAKNNPEDLKNVISSLLGDFESLYDNNRNHQKIDENQVEILEKILNADGTLKNFICGTIHGFIMETLRECNIEAGILAGRAVNSENHATLIYKCGDNQYIFNDYTSNSTIMATNILDAAKVAYKKSGTLESAGFFNLSDDKKSYREFILEEAAYNELYDKSSDNKNSPFSSPLKENSSIKVNFNTGKNGEIITGVESVLTNISEYNLKNLDMGIQYKKGKIGELVDNSNSIGAKFNFKKDNQEKRLVTELGTAISYTQGSLGEPDAMKKRIDDKIFNSVINQLKTLNFTEASITNTINNINSINEYTTFEKNDVKYLSAMLKAKIGKYDTLYSDSNLNVENMLQATGMMTNTLSIKNGIGTCMDGRITIEDGINLQHTTNISALQAYVNAGVVIDANATYGTWTPKPIFGSKVNLGISDDYKINDQTQMGLTLQGYKVKTSPAKDIGASATAYVAYKPQNTDVDLIFNTGVNMNKRNLSVGGFNEKIHDKREYTIAFKALIKDKYTLGINYNQNLDKLNKTRNKKIFGVNFGINF